MISSGFNVIEIENNSAVRGHLVTRQGINTFQFLLGCLHFQPAVNRGFRVGLKLPHRR
jgi:hypothetical protein